MHHSTWFLMEDLVFKASVCTWQATDTEKMLGLAWQEGDEFVFTVRKPPYPDGVFGVSYDAFIYDVKVRPSGFWKPYRKLWWAGCSMVEVI